MGVEPGGRWCLSTGSCLVALAHGKEIGPTVRLRALTNRHRRTGIRYPNSCGPLAPRVPEVMAACYILCLNLRQAPRAKDIIFAMRSGP